MNFVVDSNILFSIVISGEKSKAFKLVENSELELYFPEEGILELRSHKRKLSKYSNEFELRVFLAFTIVRVIPQEFYEDKIRKAFQIAKEFDEKDTPFIALALKLNVPIWTGDKQMIVHGLRTEEYLALDIHAVEGVLDGKNLEEIKEDLKNRYL